MALRWSVSTCPALALVQFGHRTSFLPVCASGPLYPSPALHAAPRNGDRLGITIRGKNLVNLVVPWSSTTGEYRYAMLQSSVGQRLEMWVVAWHLFKSAPLTGVGSGAYMASAQKLVDEGSAPPVTSIYDHPHNEYLDALSSRGLVGLAAATTAAGLASLVVTRAGSTAPIPVRMGASLAGLLVMRGIRIFRPQRDHVGAFGDAGLVCHHDGRVPGHGGGPRSLSEM